jgi:hypothetical protein
MMWRHFQPSMLSNPDAMDSKQANIVALGAVRSLVTANRVIPTFQGVLTEASTAIYNASAKGVSGQNWVNAPKSVFEVNTKAAIAFYLLALLADLNSNFRNYAITTANNFRDKAPTEAESDPAKVAAKASAIGSDIATAYARSLVSPGVSSDEVSRWARYFTSVFGFSFNEEMIRRQQSYATEGFGDQTVSNLQYATDKTGAALHQGVNLATDAGQTARQLAGFSALLPIVIPIVAATGLFSVMGLLIYKRSKRNE